jgi:hypothetical protein
VEQVDFDALWNPRIFIENVLGKPTVSSSRAVRYEQGGEAYVVDKIMVEGNFFEALELWEFPFDVQVNTALNCNP